MTKVVRDLDKIVLHDWTSTNPVPVPSDGDPPAHAVVFVHGILSEHTRFRKCYDGLSALRKNWCYYYVDYDYHAPLTNNGNYLATTLVRHFRAQDHVVLIGHSMGGLVIRLACLVQKLPFVSTIFLLGTPNHGAFRTSSLSILMQMTRAITGKVWGIRHRKVGIFDLTRVTTIMDPYLKNAPQTAAIDYISMPGRYFHKQRGVPDHRLEDTWKVIFGGMDAGFELVRAFLPLLSIKLARAHDGIVEEDSNSLIPEEAERTSEKRNSIRHPRSATNPATYAHLVPDCAIGLVHVEIPDDERIIRVIADIIGARNL